MTVESDWKPAPHEGHCHGSPEDKATGFCSHQAHFPAPPRPGWRANYVPAPHFYNLSHACALINKAFEAFGKHEGFGCYLVGSTLLRKDFRDVDVRFILGDEAYDRVFKNNHGYTNPLWSLLCVSISAWLSKATELPVDFQVQRQSEANKNFSLKNGHGRQPLGLFHDYPSEEKPTEESKP